MLCSTNVVQVTVSEEHCFDAIFATLEARHVGDQVIDTHHVFVWELKTEVDDVNVAIYFYNEAVAANLLESTEWIHAKVLWSSSSRILLCWLRARLAVVITWPTVGLWSLVVVAVDRFCRLR